MFQMHYKIETNKNPIVNGKPTKDYNIWLSRTKSEKPNYFMDLANKLKPCFEKKLKALGKSDKFINEFVKEVSSFTLIGGVAAMNAGKGGIKNPDVWKLAKGIPQDDLRIAPVHTMGTLLQGTTFKAIHDFMLGSMRDIAREVCDEHGEDYTGIIELIEECYSLSMKEIDPNKYIDNDDARSAYNQGHGSPDKDPEYYKKWEKEKRAEILKT